MNIPRRSPVGKQTGAPPPTLAPGGSKASVFYLEKRNSTRMCCFPSIIHSGPPEEAEHEGFLLLFGSSRKEPGSPSCRPYEPLCRSCPWCLRKCAPPACLGRGGGSAGSWGGGLGGVVSRSKGNVLGKQRQQDEPLPLEGSESLPRLPGPPVLKPGEDKTRHQQA